MNINFFAGRLSIKGFLIRLGMLIFSILLFFFLIRLYGILGLPDSIIFTIVTAFILLLLIPLSIIYYFSLVARRLHDLGKSGAWSLLILASLGIEYVFFGLSFAGIFPDKLVSIVVGLFNLIFLLYLVLTKGNNKTNKFGSP